VGGGWWKVGALTRQVPFDSSPPSISLPPVRCALCQVQNVQCRRQSNRMLHATSLSAPLARSLPLWTNGTRIVSGEITVKERGKSTTRTITSVWHIWQCVFKLAKTKRMWQPQNRIEHSGKVSGKWEKVFSIFLFLFFLGFLVLGTELHLKSAPVKNFV